MNWINNPSNAVLGKSLDALWQRQQAISKNISNATTPGYKRKVVSFEDVLERRLSSMPENIGRQNMTNRIEQVGIRSSRDRSTTMNVDGNNVDADVEFMQLTETAVQYQYIQRMLNDNFSRLRYAITEGRG